MLKEAVSVRPPVDLYIIPLSTEMSCLKLATKLRNKGLKVDIDMAGRRLKKSLDFANKQGIPYVVLIGENELETGELMLKEMKTGKEYKVSMDRLEELAAELLSARERV
ncbi:His/Gly/Thr/Pro-type tRNA ligase C-terminal domain-containing protein [Pseudoclostridium thermosuccinogenes]